MLVVTSPLRSKRVAMCFRKAGFTHVRLVTSYESRSSSVARTRLHSALPAFRPGTRRYRDPLNLLRWGFSDAVVAVRELVAIAAYRWHGLA